MTAYGSFYFFAIVGILLIPTIIAGLKGKMLRKYNAVLTLVMLVIIFSDKPKQAIMLAAFIIWQYALIKGYLILRKQNNSTFRFYMAVILSILPLVLAKIAPFVPELKFVVFLGMSYVTFRAVQMVFEVRDNLIKELSFFNFWEFVLFFPAISTGPIDRYRRFQKDIQKPPSVEEYQNLLYTGLNRIFQGFLYKFIIAYLIKQYFMDPAFAQQDTILSNMIYMYSYSLYLFFDFAGYSSFVIGVSYMMGIKTPENFNKPFISRNIKDFWNRWHMSLSFWFRDFIYMRFVFFATKKKLIKNRYTISYIGAFLNFFIMGIWHITGEHVYQYIIYGLYHAALFILFDIFERKNKKHKFWPNNKFTHVLAIVITFHVVCFGFLIFSGHLNRYF
ncbi:D-alanyl-lipoteichoic acid biosynthesis protein DltB [Bacillus sp. TH22]|uniref:D-alanyl-lipoteichoic acid biosynthesis protein DltB n=1 Tax=unclassified Bacillus (in: firmicutes) TaxID=185979 RepID=UPI001911454D|nr:MULTISPECIES: D-alanyl-lipoteichoic acid biosynthesis protein DltB [unclassified Bacillus (in: firmicutes)]MBK5359603.1 D-alanyl-lipoteichoic acid biosynthesis protein DltB [Bacillus sp. TH44]MBK5346897.1 D-alanyl-lipoteichoic acid biosynthesis protein DltB [Bacillus sp. TH45]MBK5366204.1 D-alanyl-lipoteichoic acid biosynthesis protein DltB [Bacillus sp. TH50]MBK5448699.1 D-alanyl-lipoteichoic acid biosynthesis protein DltB [Bacillus sp. TH22]MBK5457361.1 D-alanyl-lipoteichoic acid biosynth